MLDIYKQINKKKIKQELSGINYSLYSIYKTKDLRGETDNPLPYESQYALLTTSAFQTEFKKHLQEIIRSGVFQTTFEVSYYPQMDVKNIEEVTSLLTDLLNRPFNGEYDLQFKPEVEKLITELYTASAIVGGQMANILEPSNFVFDLVDRETITQLNNIGIFWISEGATKHIVTDTVTALAKEAIEMGMGLDAAGELFRNELLGVAIGKSEIYYNNLASIVMNRARNVARINTFSRLGITTAEWVGIPDARQCDRCFVLDGTTWQVEHLKTAVDRLLMATTPEEVIEANPFINSIDHGTDEFVLNNGMRVATSADTEVLAKMGVICPCHGGCRCSIEVYTS